MKIYYGDDLPTREMALETLALYNVPLTGQRVLSNHPEESVREALASSTLTHIDIINALACDKSAYVRSYAMIRTTNPDDLAKTIRHWTLKDRSPIVGNILGSSCVARATRNLIMPAEELAKMLTSKCGDIALAAYCNPNTPEKARRKLTLQRASGLLREGGTIDGHLLCAYELVAANPWMFDRANKQKWGKEKDLREALTAMRAATKLRGETVASLLRRNTIAADIAAINKPEFNRTHAKRIQTSRKPPAVAVMPYILGRLVNRFGISIIEPQQWCIEWLMVTSRSARALNFANLDVMRNEQLQETCDVLGDNPHHWETFTRLMADWHGTMLEAAAAASKL